MLTMMLDQTKRWWDTLALAFSVVVSHSFLILVIAVVTHFSGHLVFGQKIDHFLIENIKFFGSLSLVLISVFLISNTSKSTASCCKQQ